MARTNTLGNFLTDVADAIRTAEGSSDPITASDFDTRISALGGGGGLDEGYTGSISSGSNASTGILQSIKKVPALALSGTSTAYMFSKMQNVEEIDCSLIDTTNVTNMQYMFNNCYKLNSLDLKHFYTTNVTNLGNTFYGCTSLQFLDIRNFTFDSITGTSANTFTGIPTDCLIIVKSQTEKDWILSKRSDFTNIKTVAEYEASL